MVNKKSGNRESGLGIRVVDQMHPSAMDAADESAVEPANTAAKPGPNVGDVPDAKPQEGEAAAKPGPKVDVKCPQCGVVGECPAQGTDRGRYGIRRSRKCRCGHSFSTIELWMPGSASIGSGVETLR